MGMPLVRLSFTVGEYHRMAEAGILGEDDRVELIDGQVVAMTPIGPEVGDTSFEADRRTKIPLYSRTGIPEAWLVNLPADTIQCYREPTSEGYADIRTVQRGETLTPVRLPGITLRVDAILG